MKHEILRISPHKAGKVAAAIYGLLSLGIVPILWMAMLAAPRGFGLGGVFFLVLPFLYALFGYVFTALAAMTYNFVVKYTGGIEVEVESVTV